MEQKNFAQATIFIGKGAIIVDLTFGIRGDKHYEVFVSELENGMYQVSGEKAKYEAIFLTGKFIEPSDYFKANITYSREWPWSPKKPYLKPGQIVELSRRDRKVYTASAIIITE